jgi:hypothetical protein
MAGWRKALPWSARRSLNENARTGIHVKPQKLDVRPLDSGINAIAAAWLPGKRAATPVFLFLAGDKILKITSAMHDVEPRLEVGTLVVTYASKRDIPSDVEVISINNWSAIPRIFRLEIVESNIRFMSGLCINNAAGEEFYICCGDMPYSVFLQAPFGRIGQASEYELSVYTRILVSD